MTISKPLIVLIGGIAVLSIVSILYSSSNRIYTSTYRPQPHAAKISRVENEILEKISVSEPEEKVQFVGLEEIMAGPLDQDDPRIINYIKRNHLILPPSDEMYNLTRPDRDPSMGQSTVVKKIFGNMRDGFFVECGGLDGETRSNTLNLEKEFGWKGLLIEGDPKNFNILVGKHRKAWAANVCLATKPYPHQVLFHQSFSIGKIVDDAKSDNSNSNMTHQIGVARVQCFPLLTLLSALDIKTVDYFSLDVEGIEFQVLQNIPFDKVLIKVLSVEYMHSNNVNESALFTEFMKTKGYRVITEVTNSGHYAFDLIFAHESVFFNETIEPIRTDESVVWL